MSDLTSITNKQIYYAQNLLTLYEQAETNHDPLPQRTSLEAGFWFAIREACQCWLYELAGYLGVNLVPMQRIEDILDGQLSQYPDAQYLINLKRTPDSWLAVLIEKTGTPGLDLSIEESAEVAALPSGMVKNQSINTLVIATDSGTISTETDHRAVLNAFKTYVQQIRTQHVEW